MTAPMLAPTAVPMPSSPYSMMSQPIASSSRHILARMQNSICLLETSATPSSPEVVDVYHHEFAGVFRFSHTTSVYKGDYTLLETLGEDSMMPDEEHAVVIVSREIMALVARKTMPLPLPPSHKRHSSRNLRVPQSVWPAPTRRVVRGWNAGL